MQKLLLIVTLISLIPISGAFAYEGIKDELIVEVHDRVKYEEIKFLYGNVQRNNIVLVGQIEPHSNEMQVLVNGSYDYINNGDYIEAEYRDNGVFVITLLSCDDFDPERHTDRTAVLKDRLQSIITFNVPTCDRYVVR